MKVPPVLPDQCSTTDECNCSDECVGRPDGARPVPGGWNRIELVVDDLAAAVDRLRNEGVSFRNDIVTGPGEFGSSLTIRSGTPIELFQPAH